MINLSVFSVVICLTVFAAVDQESAQNESTSALKLGPITMEVRRSAGLSVTPGGKNFPPFDLLFDKDLTIDVGGQAQTFSLAGKDLKGAADYIQQLNTNRVTPQVRQRDGHFELQLQPLPGTSLKVSDGSAKKLPTKFFVSVTGSPTVLVSLRQQDGSLVRLDQGATAEVDTETARLAVISVGEQKSQLCADNSESVCYNEYLLFYQENEDQLAIGAHLENARQLLRTANIADTPKYKVDKKRDRARVETLPVDVNPPVLKLEPSLLAEKDFFIINGRTAVTAGSSLIVQASQDAWRIERYPRTDSCRAYSKDERKHNSAVIQPPRKAPREQRQNGIMVGDAKVFDVAALTRMLNDTASQLAAISGFNSASIAAAYGNVQGMIRDTSYLNAQVTTLPTPSISQTSSFGATTPNTTSTTLPVGATKVNLQCPDGSLPAIGASGTLGGCSIVPVTGTTGNVPAYAPVNAGGVSQGTLTTTPAGSTTVNTGTTTTSQNGVTTTIPTVSGLIPGALASTAPAAPTNIGYGSADILAEQVQINSQLTTYRLLLQGALSDQYLLRNSRAIAVRQQTTVGFTVSLDPPRQFRHAVAEVRIIMAPPVGQDKVSIMNLLPSEKTYNVAKVSSKQTAFGAGVVMEPVSVGVNTGKAKDRLYLAKDTDTIALQFPYSESRLRRPFPQFAHDVGKSVEEFQVLSSCSTGKADVESYDLPGALQFGWQFRPVLGADYVRGGQRQVFAQIALPAGLEDQYVPKVWVETRWRAYDPNRQVVGAVYSSSCTEAPDLSGVVFSNQPQVRNVELSDLGGGQVKLTVTGEFYSSGLSVRAGAASFTPIFFDGKKLELVGNAHDMLEAGELTLIGPNGRPHPLSIPVPLSKDEGCILTGVTASALPRPDGNSRVEVTVTGGNSYNPKEDGDLKPLVLVGNQVYGLKETPFLQSSCSPAGKEGPNGKSATASASAVCKFTFMAPTTDLRNAQTVIAKDLTWRHMEQSGPVKFAPSFTSLSLLMSPDPVTTSAGADTPGQTGRVGRPKAGKAGKQPKPATAISIQKQSASEQELSYTVSGFDLSKVTLCQDGQPTSKKATEVHGGGDEASSYSCLRIYAGTKDIGKDLTSNFEAVTDNVATFHASRADLKNVKKLRFLIQNGPEPAAHNFIEWDLDVPLPKPGESKPDAPVASPLYISTGDSRKVAFTGIDFSKVDDKHITFDGAPVPAMFNAESKSLEVMVSSAITSKPGHKEFTAPMKDGKSKPIQLSVEVVRQ